LILSDHHPRRTDETSPLFDEVAIFVKNLDALVQAVGDMDAALGTDRDAVRPIKLWEVRSMIQTCFSGS
jgi:hypothetical protein